MNRQGAKDAKDAKFGENQREEPPTHLDEIAHVVIGAAIEVHRHLGPGFLERVYEEAMVIELGLRNLRVRRQVAIDIAYKGNALPSVQLDLLVEDELVLELKAVSSLSEIHMAQLMSYLRAGAFQLGLLINFNVLVLKQGIRRVVWSG